MNPNPTPTVGRIVHYKARGSADGKFPSVARAAIITDVREHVPTSEPASYDVRVCVLNPEGIFFSDWLTEGTEPGNWSWPPRV